MKLKSFTVQKYRSIIAAKRIPVGRKTVLVGPNNEGKSNILRALITAMNLLTRWRQGSALYLEYKGRREAGGGQSDA